MFALLTGTASAQVFTVVNQAHVRPATPHIVGGQNGGNSAVVAIDADGYLRSGTVISPDPSSPLRTASPAPASIR